MAFTKSGERLVGMVAKRQAITNPENTVYSIKRFMGRRLNEVGDEMKMVPYKVVAKGDNIAVVAQGKEYKMCIRDRVYAEAFAHAEELCKPYATVIDIDYAKLPSRCV